MYIHFTHNISKTITYFLKNVLNLIDKPEIMKTATSIKLKLFSFFTANTSESNKEVEVKTEKKSVVNLRSIPKEEIDKNRCHQYEYAL